MKPETPTKMAANAPVRYFHEITDQEWTALQASGMTWAQCAKEYAAPAWCDYPDAVDPLGCWSLVDRMVKSENYCAGCDLYRKGKT